MELLFIALKHTLNVPAEVRSVSNFFWSQQYELIFHKVFPKKNRFSSLVTKPLTTDPFLPSPAWQ